MKRAVAWLLPPLLALTGCLATTSDIGRIEARYLGLNTRLKQVEGTAENLEEVVSSRTEDARKSLFARINEVQDLIRDLRSRIATLEEETGQLQGQSQWLEQQLSAPQAGTTTTVRGRLDALQDQVHRLSLQVAGFRRTMTGLTARIPSAKALYDASRKAYKAHSYSKARELLETLVTRYPGSALVPNAHFWMGEIYFARKEWINAIDKYKVVIDKYPRNRKASAAYLKTAMALKKIGEKQLARDVARELIEKYPKSSQVKAARKIAKK